MHWNFLVLERKNELRSRESTDEAGKQTLDSWVPDSEARAGKEPGDKYDEYVGLDNSGMKICPSSIKGGSSGLGKL